MSRRLLVALGAGAVVAGLVLAVVGETGLPGWAGPAAFVGVVVLALAAGAFGTLDRVAEGPRTTPLPTPGRRDAGSVPGDDVDELLATVGSADPAEREALRERIAAAAVATLVRTEGVTPATARERIAAGTWTDDERAAAFLAAEAPRPPLADRLRGLVRGESTAARRARHAIDAVARRHEDSPAGRS